MTSEIILEELLEWERVKGEQGVAHKRDAEVGMCHTSD